MKRTAGKLLAIILTLALVFGTQSFVFAADTDYGLIFDTTLGEFWLDEDDDGVVSGGDSKYTGQDTAWSWDGATSTLTLTDFEWETPAANALFVRGDITLNLAGSNSFVSIYDDSTAIDTSGLKSVSNLTITGGGALLTGGGKIIGGLSTGITVTSPGSVTINGGAVTAIGDRGTISAGIACAALTINYGSLEAIGGTAPDESSGIFAGEVTIFGGEVTATAGSAPDSLGVFVVGDLVINDGTLMATGETSAITKAPTTLPADYEWFASETLPYTPSGLGTNSDDTAYVWSDVQKFVKIQPVTTQPVATDHALIFDVTTGKFYENIAGDGDPTNPNNIEYTDQTDKWSWSNGVLTLNGFSYSVNAYDALIIVGGDLTISLYGVNTFEVPQVPGDDFTSSGISIYDGDLTIKGTGTLNAKGGSSTIYTDLASMGIVVYNGTLKIESGTVNGTGGDVDGVSYGITCTDFIQSGGVLNAKGGVTKWTSAGLNVYGGDITVSGGTLNAAGNTAEYSCGIFSPFDGTLTASGGMINATGAGTDYSDGIYVEKMIISGATVTATAGASAKASYGVFVVTDITISGGTLNAFAGASEESFGVWCAEGTLAITGSTLVASGHTSALNKAPDISALSKYTFWSNTAVTSPGGNGTKFSSKAYAWNIDQKYIKITTEKVSTTTTSSSTPKTGDYSNILVLSISMLISILGIMSIIVWRKRQISAK